MTREKLREKAHGTVIAFEEHASIGSDVLEELIEAALLEVAREAFREASKLCHEYGVGRLIDHDSAQGTAWALEKKIREKAEELK